MNACDSIIFILTTIHIQESSDLLLTCLIKRTPAAAISHAWLWQPPVIPKWKHPWLPMQPKQQRPLAPKIITPSPILSRQSHVSFHRHPLRCETPLEPKQIRPLHKKIPHIEMILWINVHMVLVLSRRVLIGKGWWKIVSLSRFWMVLTTIIGGKLA